MTRKPNTWLMAILMMFPQIIETIYSPVLPHIADAFAVTEATAAQTLSVYFTAFALGVFCWGMLADWLGRRPALLLGLITYGVGSVVAIYAPSFDVLLLARVLSAFGAAVGSVVTQTMLRDSYEGSDLAKLFSIMGAAIALSPVIGLATGGSLASLGGHQWVFSLLFVMALVLFIVSAKWLPETQPKDKHLSSSQRPSVWSVAVTMCGDRQLWLNAALVALFNIMLFSYYSLAPFVFTRMGYGSVEFGYSGVVLALGCFIGSLLNKQFHSRQFKATTLILLAAVGALIGSVGVWLLQTSLWFLLPMMLVVISFGIAIPNVLSQALQNYKQVAGTAGALFGLGYYLLIGAGLAIAAWWQQLGLVLISCALLALICTLGLFRRTAS